MRKQKRGRKFSREKDQRQALLKSLIRAFILKEKIKTTEAKAKEIQPIVEKLITRSKKNNNLHSRRLLARFFSQEVVKKLIDNIGPKYQERKGGYTRIIKLGPRKKDGSKMAIIELLK